MLINCLKKEAVVGNDFCFLLLDNKKSAQSGIEEHHQYKARQNT